MRTQQGTTLLVVLVMLVAITLLGIAGIRISGSSLMIVGNLQARKYTENIALQAIEQTMSTITPFNSPTIAVTPTPPSGLITITVSNRTCMFSAPANGYSAVAPLVPEDNIWDFTVTVTDSLTGARTVMTQGAKIRQLAGYCT